MIADGGMGDGQGGSAFECGSRSVKIYAADRGGWIYEVWLQNRVIVVGWTAERDLASRKAALA